LSGAVLHGRKVTFKISPDGTRAAPRAKMAGKRFSFLN
jgi:hypothetical protein